MSMVVRKKDLGKRCKSWVVEAMNLIWSHQEGSQGEKRMLGSANPEGSLEEKESAVKLEKAQPESREEN